MLRNIVIDSFLSFSGGFLAFFSACILAILVGYFAFSIGVSLATIENKKKHGSIVAALLPVVIGLSVIFIINFFPSEIQRLHMKYYNPSAKVAAVVIFLFSLSFLEITNFKLIYKGKSLSRANLATFFSYLFLGLAFGVAWTHCLTPILVKVITPTIQNPVLLTRGFFLLWFYAIGLAIPMILSGILIDYVVHKVDFIKENAREIKVVNGLVLAVMAIALFNKPWWIAISKTLIALSHNSWKNQIETILINWFR